MARPMAPCGAVFRGSLGKGTALDPSGGQAPQQPPLRSLTVPNPGAPPPDPLGGYRPQTPRRMERLAPRNLLALSS